MYPGWRIRQATSGLDERGRWTAERRAAISRLRPPTELSVRHVMIAAGTSVLCARRAMAQIVKAFSDLGKISRYLDGIVDIEDDDATWQIYDFSTTSEIWSESGPNVIALDPTRCDDALIAYELWDGEPATLDWGDSRSGSVYLGSGRVSAMSAWSGNGTYSEEVD